MQTKESEIKPLPLLGACKNTKLIHTQRTWCRTMQILCFPVQSVSPCDLCLVDSIGHVFMVYFILWFLESFLPIFCRVPPSPRGVTWWRPPTKTLSPHDVRLCVCYHLLLWWKLGKAPIYYYCRISLGIFSLLFFLTSYLFLLKVSMLCILEFLGHPGNLGHELPLVSWASN